MIEIQFFEICFFIELYETIFKLFGFGDLYASKNKKYGLNTDAVA